MASTTKLTHQLPSADRWRGPEPYIGKRCRVIYRSGTYGDFDRTATGIVLGASWHATNGNSTGDLVVQAEPGWRWGIRGGQYRLVSIALAHVGQITVLDQPEPDFNDAARAQALDRSR